MTDKQMQEPQENAIEIAQAFSRGHDAGWESATAHHKALASHVQEPVARVAELEETVRQLNRALREATEAPTFMGEPVIAEPTAKIKGVDEYGPLLEWTEHWVNFPVGTKLYTTPPAAQPATEESSAVQPAPVPIKPIVDPDLDVNQRLAFKLGWKSAEEAHGITEKGQP